MKIEYWKWQNNKGHVISVGYTLRVSEKRLNNSFIPKLNIKNKMNRRKVDKIGQHITDCITE